MRKLAAKGKKGSSYSFGKSEENIPPIARVTGLDTPFPYTLEHEYLPDANRILDAVERVVRF